ncbi:prephenate dehydrogenase [Leuconostoc palmae]|uniref:prephenate dehydrogenase n=1 Tax=Leuconostoc palmae TaxID=501487 RepID=UPI001C7CF4E0|nr:prephenate dehydrogenase/arogenate dehydrogenase family protein [Leuconostoc palmae]
MKIVVQGLGEMGASFASIMKQNTEHEIIGVDNNTNTLSYALKHNIIDKAATNLSEVVTDADLIFLATPIDIIKKSIIELSRITLKPGVLITDAGSTKSEILNVASMYFKDNVHFIGGHAMAGTQNSGIEAADNELYQNAPYFLITSPNSDVIIDSLKQIFAPLDAKFITISSQEHDRLMAFISDEPHILSYALVNAVVANIQNAENLGDYVAGGFKDTTRIAASNPDVWTAILMSNREAILASNQALINELTKFDQALKDENRAEIHRMISQAKTVREQF